jgi:DNA (cytosine-5)-methyltransferase 1
LLDRAFEAEGFTVVRGPDPIFGGDIRDFHVPADKFSGIIGGPPCQHWTRLMFLNPNAGKGMGWVVDEYARVVEEAQPEWFVMEEVLYAPMPLVKGYHVWDVVLSDDDVGGVQPRTRRISFGTHDGRMLHVVRHEKNGRRAGTVMATDSGIAYEEKRRVAQSVLADSRAVPVKLLAGGKEKRSVLADHGPVGRGGEQYETNLSIEDMCEYQGLPRDFTDKMPFTMHGKRAAIGNGVPQALGRAVAKAVKLAMFGCEPPGRETSET